MVLESDLVLDRLAVEASLEFAGSGEVSALALRPGVQCRSFVQRLLAPSMEYFFQTIRVVERRRERVKKMSMNASYLLLNREAFAVVNRIKALVANSASGAIEAHDFRSRHAGRLTFLEFHLVVPGSMTVAAAHAICDRIEDTLRAEMGHLMVTIHVEPEEKVKPGAVRVP